MVHEPRFPNPPTPEEIQRMIALVHQMRSEHAAETLHRLTASLTGLFKRTDKAQSPAT